VLSVIAAAAQGVEVRRGRLCSGAVKQEGVEFRQPEAAPHKHEGQQNGTKPAGCPARLGRSSSPLQGREDHREFA
jgi:hypothetical protein